MEKILNAVAQRSIGQASWIGLEARARLSMAAARTPPPDGGAAEARIEGEIRPITARGWQSDDTRFGDLTPFRVVNLGSRPLVHELVMRDVPLTTPSPGEKDKIHLLRSLYRLKDGLDPDHPVDPAADTMKRNELFIVVIEGKLREGPGQLGILTEMLPAGWRIEADNLRPDLAIAPGARAQLRLEDEDKRVVMRREAQEDRLVALLDLERARQGFRLGFLARTAHSGEFVWPGTVVAGVKDPNVVGYTVSTRVSIAPGD